MEAGRERWKNKMLMIRSERIRQSHMEYGQVRKEEVRKGEGRGGDKARREVCTADHHRQF